MSNQTIDGVPRELLERIAKHCEFWKDHAYLEAIQDIGPELRALLDAPLPAVDGEQWYADTPDGDSALVTRVAALCSHPSMSFHQVALLEGAISESTTDCKPTAQPQGEPVTIEAVAVTRDNGDGSLRLEWLLEGGIANMEFAGMVLFAIPEANDLCDESGSAEVYLSPQSAEQPAPVAVATTRSDA